MTSMTQDSQFAAWNDEQDHNDAMCKCGSYSIRHFPWLRLSRCLDCNLTDKDYRFTER